MQGQFNNITAERWFYAARLHGLYYGRFALPALVLGMLLWPNTRELVLGVLSEAFLQVSVFVFTTLLLFELVSALMRKHLPHPRTSLQRWQVPGAAFLGALPGCGGAIIVVTQFVQGGMSFGSLVAVLTATMGDAAFVLLAARPVDGIQVILIGIAAGIIVGTWVDKFQPGIFAVEAVAPQKPPQVKPGKPAESKSDRRSCAPKRGLSELAWRWGWPFALIVSVLVALQYDPDAVFGFKAGIFQFVAAIACLAALICWACNRSDSSYKTIVAEEDPTYASGWFQRIVQATHFVTAWVVVAFLLFEIGLHISGIDLGAMVSRLGLWAPVAGVLVGLLPGCGPQILMTTLYLQGALPFSALLGNAISNDGDALFPAIALAPKAAMMATLYSTPPALLMAYGYEFLFA